MQAVYRDGRAASRREISSSFGLPFTVLCALNQDSVPALKDADNRETPFYRGITHVKNTACMV
jgi:hypothetical protein